MDDGVCPKFVPEPEVEGDILVVWREIFVMVEYCRLFTSDAADE
jgi:hypothetical protein